MVSYENSPSHGMVEVDPEESDGDSERWVCPFCGRVILVNWKENAHSVLVVGDTRFAHFGAKDSAYKIQNTSPHEPLDFGEIAKWLDENVAT